MAQVEAVALLASVVWERARSTAVEQNPLATATIVLVTTSKYRTSLQTSSIAGDWIMPRGPPRWYNVKSARLCKLHNYSIGEHSRGDD
mmetsp:Transcript_136795/g.249342  ORF Transcript_136795/g.249342 Transcript_136795/m.249342 type:complete len:88 (+) Transcript_136795:1486-1749(+)